MSSLPLVSIVVPCYNAQEFLCEALDSALGQTWPAVEVIAAGIEKAKSAEDPQAVADALKTGEPIATAIGKVTYGETGDMTSQSFSLYKWDAGKIVPAE